MAFYQVQKGLALQWQSIAALRKQEGSLKGVSALLLPRILSVSVPLAFVCPSLCHCVERNEHENDT